MSPLIENETTPSDDPIVPKTHVHMVLGLILVPFVAAAVGWTLAILDVLRGYASRAQLNWTRILVCLVVVDSLVVMGWIWMLSHPDEIKRMTDAKEAPRSQIGLFEKVKERPDGEWKADLWLQAPALGFGLIAWLVGWRRFKDRGAFWLGVPMCLAGAELLSLAITELADLSVGVYLLATGAGTSALMGLTLVANRWFPLAPQLETRRPIVGSTFLGAFYLITGALRVGPLLMLADLWWFGGKGVDNPIQDLVDASRLGVLGTILIVVDTVLLAPIAEELLFRGYLLPRLLLQKGSAWAVGVSAVLFALLHPQYGMYVPLVLLYGVVLGWARLRTGGLTVPILLHLSINSLAIGTLLFRS